MIAPQLLARSGPSASVGVMFCAFAPIATRLHMAVLAEIKQFLLTAKVVASTQRGIKGGNSGFVVGEDLQMRQSGNARL
jgi:hypothetical protein